MARTEAVTFVIVGDGNEKKLSANYNQEMITIELSGKEIFRTDADNFKEWSALVNKLPKH